MKKIHATKRLVPPTFAPFGAIGSLRAWPPVDKFDTNIVHQAYAKKFERRIEVAIGYK